MKIRIGPIDYEVEELEKVDEKDSDGEILYGICKIRLKRDLAFFSKRQTLWHEIIHAILVHRGYREQPEKLIDGLAYGIMQVLQDNSFLRKETSEPTSSN